MSNSEKSPQHLRPAAAAYIAGKTKLPCAPATLARLASVGGGPIFYKIGATVLYDQDQLDEWIVSRTSEKLQRSSDYSRKRKAA